MNYGYGTGNYLTNFEDYYKSSEESEKEGEGDGGRESSCYYTESEDEDRQSYQGITKEKPRKEDENKSLKIRAKPINSLIDKDLVNDDARVFSTDYDAVCQYQCPLCSKHIDADKLSSHLSSSHVGGRGGGGTPHLRPSRYSRETWHRCGLCQKALLFTRLKVRYHVITEHGVSIKEYNEKFMTKTGRLGGDTVSPGQAKAVPEPDLDPRTVSKEQISDDYADLLKTLCKICNKTVEIDKFR